tara:strand:- start:60 stop:320 length:261 start_codon:yes stop_codon:yes gene_type:complete
MKKQKNNYTNIKDIEYKLRILRKNMIITRIKEKSNLENINSTSCDIKDIIQLKNMLLDEYIDLNHKLIKMNKVKNRNIMRELQSKN